MILNPSKCHNVSNKNKTLEGPIKYILDITTDKSWCVKIDSDMVSNSANEKMNFLI